MNATEAKLLEFLRQSPQFIIPIYQRTYSWTEPQCQQLWDDILRTGENEKVPAHFVGSIVYIQQGMYSVSDQSPLLVIDGQQRLTTVTIILEALARAVGDDEPVKGFSAVKIRNRYLQNADEDEEDTFKLILTQNDKETLLALVDQQTIPEEHSIRVKENFDFFCEKLKALDDLVPLCTGLMKLMVVDVALTRGHDNPQLIFESMNSTGKELSQADLIRNFILMGLEPKLQTKLYNHHWRPMEVAFGQQGYSDHFDAFMRHYLTVKTGDIPKKGDVYEVFKVHSQSEGAGDVDELVADIHAFAGYYCAMALGKEKNKKLDEAFADLREFKANVAYPFLLHTYHDYAQQVISTDEMEEIVRMVESYVFRRAVVNIPTNSMNKTFANFKRELKAKTYVESVKAHFLLMKSYRRFPSDEEFEKEIKVRDLYNFPRKAYWLRRIENFGRKERVYVDEYTIEHIMPQNDNLSDAWQTDLGKDWGAIQSQYLHTLGNLTLTGYNSEYSDRPFKEKRDMEGGFKVSPLHMNEGLGDLNSWNEAEIKNRADKLSVLAAKVWSSPALDSETLDSYRPKKKVTQNSYTIDNHKHLGDDSKLRPLFDILRKEILALDECVVEEFLKFYVAYKAETNFVDIVPKATMIRLILNLKFNELHDPKEIAKDFTNKKRWGNGDVEVDIKTSEEIPYAMGLVRQSLESQMDSTEA